MRLWRTNSDHCPVGDLAPAWGAIQAERDHLCDLIEDIAECLRSVDILEDAASLLFEQSGSSFQSSLRLNADGQCGSLMVHLALQSPSPGSHYCNDPEQQHVGNG